MGVFPTDHLPVSLFANYVPTIVNDDDELKSSVANSNQPSPSISHNAIALYDFSVVQRALLGGGNYIEIFKKADELLIRILSRTA